MFFFRKPSLPGLSITEAVDAAARGDLLVIDVREAGELAATGKAAGALHVPLMQLSARADRNHPEFEPLLEGASRIAVYCASGGRSARARKLLLGLGYPEVHNLGGLGHWARAGGRIERA
ncbi:sulfurtransferase [Ruegeria pomeroyi]|uniref:Rhodanese-like domain protein n=2 Tax=Ruegeria pomeroyi TaxID=89184 RepID=Q5LRB0_RUEPO|nr:rhodanese-like domain-containing protein [Ruegeria pomeroyi]AAV95485.1 rhodanese-like domain protein [Ruegeria pomeroyi DSS-3]NVK97090.1 sulfurtransferase [Ruegeria pomeroyi]NVL03585.1 sulfurtransferase [Ruegeria pomeroyi]QWV09050.1 sulfurtransferase [Ruegeria pomeroyi]QWV09067.1 sulfurtransferase [Ruegeria pomeroyi]